jgi:hypothetical protein
MVPIPEETATGRKVARALSDAAIRGLREGESRTDGSLPIGYGRLMVRCTKARGALRKAWIFRARTGDNTIKMHLGDYPALTLEEARTRARTHIEQVKQGVDPRIAAFEQRQAMIEAHREQAALGVFRTLLASYVAHLRAKGKASAKEVEQLFERHVLKPWPRLAELPARSITPEMIRDILARMIKAGIRRQTNVARSYLHAAFVHGAHADLDPRRAADEAQTFRLTTNPVSLLPRIEEFETTRDRVLTNDELRLLWTSLETVHPHLAAAIRCVLLLAGQRFRQLLRARMDDYNVAARVLKLADPKGKRSRPVEHLLPVSDAVAAQLDMLLRTNTEGPYIFSTTLGEKPIHHTTLGSTIAAIATATCSAENRYRPGDVRRTVETRLQALGVSRDERAQLLSHGRTSGVQGKHYERYDYLDEKRAVLVLWEKHLARLLKLRRLSKGRSTNSSPQQRDVRTPAGKQVSASLPQRGNVARASIGRT